MYAEDAGYPPTGTPMEVQSHPSHNVPTATQHYAGDVMDASSMFRNMQESNAISRSISRPEQESKPKAPVVPLKPFNKPNFYEDSIKR